MKTDHNIEADFETILEEIEVDTEYVVNDTENDDELSVQEKQTLVKMGSFYDEMRSDIVGIEATGIGDFAEKSPENMQILLIYVLQTIQAKWHVLQNDFPKFLEILGEKYNETDYRKVFPSKDQMPSEALAMDAARLNAGKVWVNRKAIYDACIEPLAKTNASNDPIEKEAHALRLLQKLLFLNKSGVFKGLGLVKTAFSVQLMTGQFGCIDVNWINFFSELFNNEDFSEMIMSSGNSIRTVDFSTKDKKIIEKMTPAGERVLGRYLKFLELLKTNEEDNVSQRLWTVWTDFIAAKIVFSGQEKDRVGLSVHRGEDDKLGTVGVYSDARAREMMSDRFGREIKAHDKSQVYDLSKDITLQHHPLVVDKDTMAYMRRFANAVQSKQLTKKERESLVLSFHNDPTEGNDKAVISEMTQSEALDHTKSLIASNIMACISAERTDRDDSENATKTNQLHEDLIGLGYVILPAKGTFENEPEASFVVFASPDKKASFETVLATLATEYDQDSVLFADVDGKNGFVLGTSHAPNADPQFGQTTQIGDLIWEPNTYQQTQILSHLDHPFSFTTNNTEETSSAEDMFEEFLDLAEGCSKKKKKKKDSDDSEQSDEPKS